MRRSNYLPVLLLLVLIPAQAKEKPGRGRGRDKGEAVEVFRSGDRAFIADYYRSRPGGLPPGLEKQLRRNGRLPPGLEKRLTPFPPEVESRLPPCPPDVRRGMVGGVALMYSSRTGLVLDVMATFGR